MNLIYPRCCVLAVQGETVLACVRIQDADHPARDEVRSFAILPAELATLSDWLAAHGVTHVAIESTSHAWKPIYLKLQQAFTMLLIDPGRVTDVKDIGRVASLLAYGLEPYRVIPAAPLREAPRHRRRNLITVGTMMLAALLASYWVWTHPSRMDSEHLPGPPPSHLVRWQQPFVAYEYPAGQQVALPLPTLERSPDGVPVEVGLDATGDRPSWLQFDREQRSMHGMAPSTTEDKTYQLIVRAQAEHGSESRLQVSLTIRGQPDLSPSSRSTQAPPPPPPQAAEPRPSEHFPEPGRLMTILESDPPDSPVSTGVPSPPPPQTAGPRPSEFTPETARVLTILKGSPPPSSSSAAAEARPLSPPRLPKPVPSDPPVDKDCILRVLKGEACVNGR